MAQLNIQVPESLLEKLRKQAQMNNKSVEEIVIEKLEVIPEVEEQEMSEKERMERFIRESGLFAPPGGRLGPELGKLARPVSEEERDQLAKVLSKGKPLSEMIIEDRGE